MALKRLILAWFAALLLAMPAHAQNFPKRDREPVVDAANLLSAQQKAEITALAEDINAKTTRQFVVATIPDLEGYPIEDYGYRLGRAWKLGQKDANNGIILIVAPKERRVRIEVGYGLEPIMTDAMSSMIVNDQILPRFKGGDVPGGIIAGAREIAEQMKLPLEAAEARAKEQVDKAGAKRPERRNNRGGGFPWGLAFWGIVLAAILIPMFARGFGGSRRAGPWGARRYRRDDDGGALPILLWTIASELSRGSSHGSGWGGDSGGGGSDWGGGGDGGGFSGGGGSFGGGGASGSW